VTVARPGGSAPGRNYPVDALRGVLALCVVVYHLVGWLQLPMPAWLSATGLVGVDAFFVISGYALAHVYRSTDFGSGPALASYALRRVLRIAPLLFVATVAVAGTNVFLSTLLPCLAVGIVLARDQKAATALQAVLLACAIGYALVVARLSMVPTLTLAWGFVDPTLSIAGGSWSIGLEMVFYVLLPLLLVAWHRRPAFFWALLAASCLLAVGYQFARDTHLPGTADYALLRARWRDYVSPLNHAYFFVAGAALALLEPVRARMLACACALAACVAVYVALSPLATPDSGAWRFVYSLLAVGVTAAIAYMPVQVTGRARQACHWLGETSYGVYLLHFAVHTLVHPHAALFASRWQELAATVLLVVVLAVPVRIFFERNFESLGRVRSRPASPSSPSGPRP
jgi:peptidoglycan/LPS O-acetylase OafA/YrhL